MRIRLRDRFRDLMLVMMTATVVAVLSLAVRPTAGQAPAYKAPRTADGRPNLNGIWQAFNTANWDIQAHPARAALAVVPGPMLSGPPPRRIGLVPAPPLLALGAVGAVPAGLGVVEGNEIPYQPWAAAKKKENFENSLTHDPEVKCYLPGVPRATYMPFPFQIVQTPTHILMAYEFAGGSRTVFMNSKEESPVESWMGWSHGRWEGETLVVDVTDFNDQTWFDRAGNFHSEALHVVERYTPMSPDHLMYEAIIEDPKVFTRPWKMSMPLYRRLDKQMQLLEFKCAEFVAELMYGDLRKERLATHWEGDYGRRGGKLVVDITRRPTAEEHRWP